MKKCLAFIKKEPVFCVAIVLALVSMCIMGISKKYMEYIDINVLILLFALMAVVAGMREQGLFGVISDAVMKRCKSLRSLALLLSIVNFFMAMLITNDVALITFVPLSLLMLEGQRETDKIWVVVLETIAANLGSMLTPIGNPQNLYLFSYAGYGVGEFIGIMLPVTLVSLVLVCVIALCMPKRELRILKEKEANEQADAEGVKRLKWKMVVYPVLFVVCLLAVFHVIPHWIVLLIVLAALLIFDRKILLRVDYILLLTFVAFFIFIGNLGEIAAVREALRTIIAGREGYVGILASQIFSNVPAAMLLSTFSEDIAALLWGVNIGGLGTLIASMASLISYKFYAAREGCQIGKYMLIFTLVNVVLLILLTAFMALWFQLM